MKDVDVSKTADMVPRVMESLCDLVVTLDKHQAGAVIFLAMVAILAITVVSVYWRYRDR